MHPRLILSSALVLSLISNLEGRGWGASRELLGNLELESCGDRTTNVDSWPNDDKFPDDDFGDDIIVWGKTSEEHDTFNGDNVNRACMIVMQRMRELYLCRIKEFHPLSYRVRRDTKYLIVILVRGIITTTEGAEDVVHLEMRDHTDVKTLELISMANRQKGRTKLPERVIHSIKPCPRRPKSPAN